MKKYCILTFLTLLTILLLISCDLRYSYATMTITNNTNTNLAYKVLVRDEQSSDTSGDWIIKIILPMSRPLKPGETDIVNHTWKDGYPFIKCALCWGFEDPSNDILYNVYDNTSDYYIVSDGQNITFSIDSTTDMNYNLNSL